MIQPTPTVRETGSGSPWTSPAVADAQTWDSANVVDHEVARDGNLATSRSHDDLFPLFRRGSTGQSTDAGNCS